MISYYLYKYLFVPVVTFLTAFVWIRIIKKADPYSHEKDDSNMIFRFFLYGTLSIPLTYIAGYLLYNTFDTLFSESWRYNVVLYDFIAVGLLEESAKFFIFFIFAVFSNAVKEPKDGILLGASVALAFAVIENVIYSTYGATILIFRALSATAGHMSLAAVWGYFAGVIIYFYKLSSSKRIDNDDLLLLLYSLIFAAFLHALHNILSLEYGMLLDLIIIIAAVKMLSVLNKKSPYKKFPYSRYKEAIPELKMGLSLNPGSFLLHREIALHYMRSSDYRNAGIHFKKACRIRPSDISVKLYLKIIQLVSGDSDGAYEDACRLLKITDLKQLNEVYRESKKIIQYSHHRLLLSDFFNKLINKKTGN